MSWPVVLEVMDAMFQRPKPFPTPAEFAKARLLEVVAADRARCGDGRWVSGVPRVRVQMLDMGWTPGAVRGHRIWLKNTFRWEPRR